LLLGALIYLVFYLLNRIPVISKAFTGLAITHYWRKYRQTDVDIGMLASRKQQV
jgi:hypothetical protein